MNLQVINNGSKLTLQWDKEAGAAKYRLFWSDRETAAENFKPLPDTTETACDFPRIPDRPYRLYVQALDNSGNAVATSETAVTPVLLTPKPQLETLDRGLVAVKTARGVFLSWRLMRSEVTAATKQRIIGESFTVCRNGQPIATVEDSTNYLDASGTEGDTYTVAPVGGEACAPVSVWEKGYLDLPLQKPEGGVTPAGQTFEYTANDMSVGDVDGDGVYEYIVKWDPTNSQDVSIKGYTGRCMLDCYKLDGQLLWRLDMGPNIRAGAHYTQFMVCDFDGDGKAEMSVKTAPGSRMTRYNPDGSIKEQFYVTMPESDLAAGYSHQDNYVCSGADYRRHVAQMFKDWHQHPEVVRGQWPATQTRWRTISSPNTPPPGLPATSWKPLRASSTRAPNT